jgi:hypothetical protein
MSNLRSLAPIAALALLLAGYPLRAEEQPQLLPTRDVDITYEVSRPQQPQQPKIRERIRWLASEHLERVDGPDKSTTIFDRNTREMTLLTPSSRTYRKLESASGRPLEPEAGAVLTRGGETVVAGLHCVEWSWTEDETTRRLCATEDGVVLRLVVDGKTAFEARAVSYGPQKPELFQVPTDYTPALAPDGTFEQ